MQIAVTGAGGQLGGELCRRLGPSAIALDLPDFDLTNRALVREQLYRLKPAAVINTAAYTQVDKAEQDRERCMAINAVAVGYLADACTELDCPLVQISTDYVFGRDAGRQAPYAEDDDPGPLSVYGESKLAGEHQAARCPRHIIVRTCGLYGQRGPATAASNFVDTMLRLGRERPVVRVVDDQRCTPSYVPHVAAAILLLLERSAQGTYHVVNSGETTWHDFAAEIFRQGGVAVPLERITTAQYGALAVRPAYSVLSTARYAAVEGRALPAWQAALAEYLRRAAQA